jgi:hypothetical protein
VDAIEGHFSDDVANSHGYRCRLLVVRASRLPGFGAGLPTPPKGPTAGLLGCGPDMDGTTWNYHRCPAKYAQLLARPKLHEFIQAPLNFCICTRVPHRRPFVRTCV